MAGRRRTRARAPRGGRRLPWKSCSSPSGSSSGQSVSPNAVRSCASVRRKSARARSSWVTTMMRGTPAAAATVHAARVPPVTPSTALTTTTATSATRERTVHGADEVRMPGRVDERHVPLDAVLAPREPRGREPEGGAARDLLRLVVERRRPLLDAAHPRDRARSVEQRLREGRLARAHGADERHGPVGGESGCRCQGVLPRHRGPIATIVPRIAEAHQCAGSPHAQHDVPALVAGVDAAMRQDRHRRADGRCR